MKHQNYIIPVVLIGLTVFLKSLDSLLGNEFCVVSGVLSLLYMGRTLINYRYDG